MACPQGSVFDAIRKWLDDEGVAYRHLRHEPTYTSEQAAHVRGEDIRVGGKALLMKVGDDFHLFVLSAALKFDSPAVRHHFGIQRLRFATKQELRDLTGLVPGCVPPFGRPILPFDLFVDESIPANDRIAFNAGSLTDSIIMGVDDYMRLAQPTVFRFAAQP